MLGFPPSDSTIVRRTMEGHPQEFEALVFRYQKKAHAIARALGLRPPESEDAVQEAFLQAFRDLPGLREPASFGGWFLNVVRHVSIKELRRSARGHAEGGHGETRPQVAPAPSPPAPSAAEEIEQKDFREYLWRKVGELPEGTREAIFLYYYEGESVRAVARALGLSVSGAKRRLRSGREELREKLWRGLERCLRETLPSARQWRAAGRRLGLLVVASIPTSWTARAGAALVPGGGGDPVEALARRTAAAIRRIERPALVVAAKKAAALAALVFLLIFLGGAGWVRWGPGREPAAEAPAVSAVSAVPAGSAPTVAVEPPETQENQPAAEEPLAEDSSDAKDRGSVVVRVIWGEDRTPAAGVIGQVIPWGSPDLYIDERTFTSGSDGTAQVDHLFKGGAMVMLDRGGSTGVRVEPGEAREAVVEVPSGLNVQGVVVDQSGFPVGGARVWISYGGHMNWGSEVATTWPDGTFFVRSISGATYIAARARGHAASDLRPLKGETGSTVEVRLVLNGAGGELTGTVLDERGEPVVHAKVMAGAEYPSYSLLDDGATGFTPPPYLGFTDDEGVFHADSLVPGKTRVAVRAPGFVPLVEEVEVPSGSAAQVELTLRRGATLSGRVLGEGGKPVTGAQVVIGDFRDFLSIKVFSGEGGAYRLRGLPVGDLEPYAVRDALGRASTKISVKGGESLRWDPVLAKDLEIRGRLLDESGAALEGFVLLIDEAVGGGRRRATQKKIMTDAAGRFSLKELSDLSYRIAVHEPESPFPCALFEEVRPGSEEAEIRIERQSFSSAYLLGRVVNPDGNPCAGAKVICSSTIGGYRVYFTDKNGGAFRAGPLPRGRYTVEVQALSHPPLPAGEHEVEPGEERDLGVHFLKPPLR